MTQHRIDTLEPNAMKHVISLWATWVVLFGVIGHVRAAPVSFQFETTIDASSVGGGPGTLLTVVYSFEDKLVNGTGPSGSNPPTSASYGPLSSFTLNVGSESVTGSGGGISVKDDAGTTFLADTYDVRPGAFSGQLFGFDVDRFLFVIIDDDLNMFSNTDLPASPSFASRGDRQQLKLELVDPDNPSNPISLGFSEFPSTPLENLTPFSLAFGGGAIPEPSTFVLALIGLTGLGFCTWRRRKRA